MSAAWYNLVNFFVEVSGLGVNLCAGCAARLTPPIRRHGDFAFHANCFYLCPKCGWAKIRRNSDGVWFCPACYQPKLAAFQESMTAIASQAEDDIYSNPVNRWLRSMRTLMESLSGRRAYDLRAAEALERVKTAEARRQYQQTWGVLEHTITAICNTCSSYIFFYRRFRRTIGKLIAADLRSKKRLLNPGSDNLEDATDKRFAQLEVD